MNFNENAGAAAEKQVAADKNPDASNLPYSPLRSRLHNDIENLSTQNYRSQRALDILAAHPEFEEFIELLGLIRVPIRFLPLQAERALVME